MIRVLEQIERARILEDGSPDSDHLLLCRDILGVGVTPWEVE
jgi:hypothetical protein